MIFWVLLQSDLDELSNEARNADDRAKKAMADAARLADELRQEQDHALSIEKMRKGLEGQVKELQVRLDEAEAQALKGGAKIIAKLEQRVSWASEHCSSKVYEQSIWTKTPRILYWENTCIRIQALVNF